MGQPRLQTPPDAELVDAARSGLKEPMAELLRRHWGTAVLLAERVLGSPDLARDAVQEAAIAAMTDVERLRSPDRFGAWFCGIALNVSRKWLRQLRSEVPGPQPDLRSADEVVAYLKGLRDVLMYLEVCDGNMDEGSFRCEPNLSLRTLLDEIELGPGPLKHGEQQRHFAPARGLIGK